jgi:amino acid adenylation domain-containing protein
VAVHNQQINIQKFFETQAKLNPNSIALSHLESLLSYEELNLRANYLANHLISVGVKAGDIVAINLPRSIETVVSMLAILKSGAAYFPMDSSNPTARNLLCLDSAKVEVIVTNTLCDEILIKGRKLVSSENTSLFNGILADFESYQSHPEDKAYVMFTSGSTGNPKGVVVPHRAVVRLVINTNYIDIRPTDAILQFAPSSFDASTLEFWGALLNGAKLVLYSGLVLDPNLFKKEIKENQVSVLWLTAALFHLVAENFLDALNPLRVLLAGGDVLNAKYVKKVLDEIPNITVINGYGPTENTTFTCCHIMTKENPPDANVLIGKAISGTQIHILDENLNQVAQGETGELFTSGLGVALGYLNENEKSKDFFYSEKIADGLIYRTGDLVQQNGKGELKFIGRKDNQIKLRGYRISLEEIKTHIVELGSVSDALVLRQSFDAGDQLLVAYILLKENCQLDVNAVKKHLENVLPKYMIPDKYIFDKKLPINSNGKLDRKALTENIKINHSVEHLL